MPGSGKLNTAFNNMKYFLKDNLNNKFKSYENAHKNSIEEKHKLLEEIAPQKEIFLNQIKN